MFIVTDEQRGNRPKTARPAGVAAGSPLDSGNHGAPVWSSLGLALAAPALLGAELPAGDVTATVTGLRSARGQVLACLTARPSAFPDCEGDLDARAIAVPASEPVELEFGPVPAGRYAIALFHDENGNGRLDKRLLMPREGYGFSRNAPVVLGPPSFAKAAFAVGDDHEYLSIRMRYIF